jgi:hypothetical protein
MGSPLTTAPEFTDLPTDRPDDLDDAYLDGGPYPLWPILQALANRSHFARGATWGLLMWSGCITVDAGGTNTVFTVRAGPIESVTLRDSNGVWRSYNTAAETELHLADTEGPLANLANNTVYYVYAWSNSADPLAIKFQISATPPSDVGTPKVKRNYKRGEIANFRYLGFFITGPGGAPEPMRKTGDCYTFATTRIVTTGVIPQNTNLANQVLALGTAVPPHVHVVRGRVTLTLVGTPAIAANTPGGVGSVGYDSDHEEFYADDQGLRYAVLTGVGETAVWTLLVRSCSE